MCGASLSWTLTSIHINWLLLSVSTLKCTVTVKSGLRDSHVYAKSAKTSAFQTFDAVNYNKRKVTKSVVMFSKCFSSGRDTWRIHEEHGYLGSVLVRVRECRTSIRMEMWNRRTNEHLWKVQSLHRFVFSGNKTVKRFLSYKFLNSTSFEQQQPALALALECEQKWTTRTTPVTCLIVNYFIVGRFFCLMLYSEILEGFWIVFVLSACGTALGVLAMKCIGVYNADLSIQQTKNNIYVFPSIERTIHTIELNDE